MHLIKSETDFWSICEDYDALLVTTNEFVKKDSRLAMGAGIAKQFADRYPTVPKTLGDWVNNVGNLPCCIHGSNRSIISMPTKTHFKLDSNMDLIQISAYGVLDIVEKWGFERILSTAPGCGMGNLKWADVFAKLSEIWDDRFTVILPRA